MKLGISIFVILVGQSLLNPHANGVEYFDTPINYWGESKKQELTEPKPEQSNKITKNKFEWNKYLDPSNDEFFKEGDYTPPKPFMEVARNPSNENLKNWFEYIQAKNDISKRLQTRMIEFVGAQSPMSERVEQQNQQVNRTMSIDSSRFKLRMYFDSVCPHCKKMFETLDKLSLDGFQIEAVQVDHRPFERANSKIQFSRSDKQELKKHGISSVPHLIVADLKRKALLPPIQGYQEYEQIVEYLRKVE